ncbi:MAG: hypothetical protein IIA87_03075 [Nanoarchaeota archaeon]|nr:hypothetical protein [Nanoarchaeota archaeon]
MHIKRLQDKKGQAAMEFLMTYGWAILAAIIAIGVLAYFGVFTPGKFVGGSAIVTAPFYVNAWNVQATANAVNLELRNNGGEAFTIISIDVENCATITPVDFIMAAGNASSFAITPCGPTALAEGDNFKGDITITYRKSGSALDLTSTGSITEKVVAGG